MRKFIVTISAGAGTEDNKKLHEAGVFVRDKKEIIVLEAWNQDQFKEVADKLPAALRVAYQAAVAEIDSHKVADVFRFWAGGTAAAPMMADFDSSRPVRELEVPVEGFPDTRLKVEKYRPWASTNGVIWLANALDSPHGRVPEALSPDQRDDSWDYTNGPVKVHAAANDTAAKAPHEIGAIESTGDHKGEIYGGIFPDGKPGWILEEPNPLTHDDAVDLKGRALPTSKEGKYIDTIKDKGALKDIFARHSGSSSSAGYFWLAERNYLARYQQFSDGSQHYDYHLSYRGYHLPVLSVRR